MDTHTDRKKGARISTQRNRSCGGAAAAHAACALFILASCFAIYANALHGPFLFDDRINISENPYIRMTELNPDQLSRAAFQDKFQLRPLSGLSFALDHYLHRLDRTWMHAENTALHALAAFLLYLLVWELLKVRELKDAPWYAPRVAALAAALMWAAHPAHAQAVAYLVQRQTLMAASGSMGTLLFYLKWRRGPGPGRSLLYFLACAFFLLLAAGSKETGLIAPALILLAEVTVVREWRGVYSRRALIYLFLVLAAVFGLVLAALLQTNILSTYLSSYAEFDYGPGQRVLTEARVVVSYLVTMVFPHPSRLALEHHVVTSSSLIKPLSTLPAVLVLALFLAGGVFSTRRRPLAGFFVLGFFICLPPESSFIPVALMNDHRMYFYSLFVLPPLVSWVAIKRPRGSLPLLAASLILLSILTVSRNETFSSRLSLWRDSAAKSPGSHRAWANLCAALNQDRDYAEALRACNMAVSLDPEKPMATVNRAIALWNLGQNEEAAKELERAASRWPESRAAAFNYGALLEERGELEHAIKYYSRALDSDPFHFMARLRRARLYRETGKDVLAAYEYKLLQRLFPGDASTYRDGRLKK